MNCFGDFLYELRKEKGMTQADLAQALGVTNKAVSKWETGEAMPETCILLPLSRIFGVTVDELLSGKRAELGTVTGDNTLGTSAPAKDGNRDRPKPLIEVIGGAICGGIVMAGVLVYVLLGALANLWHPFWIIIPVCALSSGVAGIIFDACNAEKRKLKFARGENPVVGAICGVIMLSCTIAYLIIGALTELWHPCWVILVGGVVICFAVGVVGDLVIKAAKPKE